MGLLRSFVHYKYWYTGTELSSFEQYIYAILGILSWVLEKPVQKWKARGERWRENDRCQIEENDPLS